jgi:hypothetical protein
MPSLEEKFQRLLSIRAQILELVAEADTLVPQGGYLILSDLSELHAGLSAAPAEDPAPEVTTHQPTLLQVRSANQRRTRRKIVLIPIPRGQRAPSKAKALR